MFLLAVAVFFYGIATLIMKISFAKHDRDKNMIEAARIMKILISLSNKHITAKSAAKNAKSMGTAHLANVPLPISSFASASLCSINEELIPAYRKYEQSISQLNDVLTTSQIGVLESRIPSLPPYKVQSVMHPACSHLIQI